MSLLNSHSFECRDFHLVKDDTIAFISGGGLCFWDLKKNDRDAVWSERNGFSKVATNHKHGVFACADYGVNPNVLVYSYPSNEVRFSFSDVCSLDLLDLVISRDAKRMIAIAGVPDYQIRYFDIENGINYDMVPSKISKDFVKVIFNPSNNEAFVILNKQSIVYCEIKPVYDVSEFDQTKIVRYQVETKEYKKPRENLPFEFMDAIWDTRGKLYVSDSICRMHILHMEDFKKEFPIALRDESIVESDHMVNKYPVFKRDADRDVGNNVEEEVQIVRNDMFSVGSLVNSMILTRKHLIIANDDDNIEWYVLDKKNPDDKKGAQEVVEGKLEKETEYHFGETTTQKIVKMHYNHSMDIIYIATDSGNLYKFPFKAEIPIDEDEEYEEDKGDKGEEGEEEEQKEIDVDIQDIGYSHSKAVSFIKELPNSSMIISGGMDGKIIIWNGYEGTYITEYISESDLSCGDVNPNGSLLVVGTSKGAIKFFDITNRGFIRLIHYKKINKKERPISEVKFSPDGELIAIGSGKKKVRFVYGRPSQNFRVLGKLRFQIPVSSFVWSNSDKMPVGKMGLLAVADQGLLFAAPAPPTTENYHNKELDYDICPMYCRRIDFFLDKIASINASGEVFLTGKDKFLKKYKIPDELVAKTNPSAKAPPAPIEELPGHPLPVNSCFISYNGEYLLSGAQDGSISVREIANPAKHTQFKAHNFKSNGVCSLEMGKEISIIYSGGYEGSLFSWFIDEDMEIPQRENQMEIEDAEVKDQEEIEDNFDEDIMHYERVIEEEEHAAQEDDRDRVKADLKDELEDIRNKLRELLDANAYADELEKLERADFCVDLDARDKLQKEGNDKREKMKNEAQREIYKNEILYNKIKDKTWNQMETHLKALVGLTSNTIVFNYNIRKRTEEELRKLQLVLDLREMERKEKLDREQKSEKEVVDVDSFCKKPDAYIINGVPGYKPLILVDYEVKEEVAEIKKEGKDDRQERGGRHMAPRQPRGKPMANTAKDEKKQDEEEKKTDETQKAEKEKQDNPAWNNLYGAFELVTNNRRRNQIVIIKDLIFKIKEKFNKEFEERSHERQRLIETVNEKNNRIKEIYETLKNEGEYTKPRVNPLENPEKVLKVEPEEVGFERYLTKEEREKLEEERRKEEERIRLLNADDAGVRAVKQMMGGTLEEKKETPLTEELQREDWMNKPYDDMDDDEKIKYTEFEAREQLLKEEREKIRKNLELELRKLRNEIKEICEKYDDKLFILYRKRLEYDYRLYEQELYIVKLTLSMLIENDNVNRREEYKKEYEELVNKEAHLREHLRRLDELKRETEDEKTKKENEFRDALNKFDAKIKQIYNQIFEKDDKKSNLRENWVDDPQFQGMLIKLDPYYEMDKADAKRKKNSEFKSYEEDIDKNIENLKTTNDISDELKRRYIEGFRNKFGLKKETDRFEKEFRDLNYYMNLKEKERRDLDEQSRKKERHVQYLENQLAIAISDIEIQLRFNQGQVEIPQDEPVPRLADAILINRSLIEHKNKEIRERGKKKTDQMGMNMKTEYEKKKAEHKMLLLDWDLNDLNIKTREVHNLKLRKEMQVALTKKDQDHNQAELLKFTKQLQLLKDATDKRIEIFKKKEQKVKGEIEGLQRENHQLSAQGHTLRTIVNQRSEIADMMARKNNENNKDGESEPYKKFKEISQNKRLFELAKKQTEEIELLREELNRLKAKTFANFTNQGAR